MPRHHRLLAGLGQARPVRRDRLVRMARLGCRSSASRSRAISSIRRHLSGRFFSLMIYMHMAVPLIAVHHVGSICSVSPSRDQPAAQARARARGRTARVIVLNPAVAGPRRSRQGAGRRGPRLALSRRLSPNRDPGAVPGALGSPFSLIIGRCPGCRRCGGEAAQIDLANCNGCARCIEDCPYEAIAWCPHGRTCLRPRPRSIRRCAWPAASASAPARPRRRSAARPPVGWNRTAGPQRVGPARGSGCRGSTPVRRCARHRVRLQPRCGLRPARRREHGRGPAALRRHAAPALHGPRGDAPPGRGRAAVGVRRARLLRAARRPVDRAARRQ